jgi:N-carbamoyl-L-amino-acid hydrolase
MTAAVVQIKADSRSAKEIATDLFDELARATGDGVGITRECYAEGENRAIEIYRACAEAFGLRTSVDTGANLLVTLPGDDGAAPGIIIGSHADSVPQGGNYDGAAGVIAGLLCLIRLRADGIEPPAPVRCLIMRGEESAFYGRANIGSRALFGLLDAKDLAAKSRGIGRSLHDAMASVGADVDRIGRGEALFDAGSARAYLELHIEQGPVMIARGLPVSIVTGIRGNIRHRKVICRGEPGHSGTIPRWLRKDAVFAFADLVMRLDEHWRVLLERGLDLVVTTGIVATEPAEHAISRIPGEVEFSFEVRSQSHDSLEAFYELFRSECRAVGAERRVKFELDDRVYTEPARMDPAVIATLVAAGERTGVKTELLPSGAGHDAAVFANAGVPSGMIFVRNAHGSHNPDEAMEIEDFMKGVDLLFAAVSAPA